MSTDFRRNVRKAIKATSSQLSLSIHENDREEYADLTFEMRAAHAIELSESERSVIWSIFENNMRDLYTRSSFGWDPPAKQKELFDDLSRFLLAYTRNGLIAFAMFRFENEYDWDLLYCYDIQVTASWQKAGIGKFLMRVLEGIATQWKMEKVILTVFKVNDRAMGFYEALGFKTDETSPEEVDYRILSKTL